jgi:hypothetical protein
VWVPDAEANVCMHCNKSQFNVLNRRVNIGICIVISDLNVYLFYFLKHHCRKCGAVVCGPCSNKKFLLPVQSAKPLRVCLTCHDVLTKTKNNGGPNVSLSNSNIIAFLLYSCNIKFCVFVRRGPEHGFFW